MPSQYSVLQYTATGEPPLYSAQTVNLAYVGTGYVLTSDGSGNATWQAGSGGGIVTLDGDSGSATGSTVTISGGTTGLTTSASSATMNITGTLILANGGTSASLTASNGGIFYSTASAGAILAGTATASKMLLSGASTTPTWSTSTIPTSAGATANKVLLSDGTNYVLSTPTFPNASATSGKIIISDGTNWIASTPTYPAAAGTSGNVLTSDGTNWNSTAPAFVGLTWTTVAGSTQSVSVNNGYVINGTGCTLTLPATAAIGSIVEVMGIAGTWIVTANTGQTIKYGATSSSSAGTITSAAVTDNIVLRCIVANTTWAVVSAVSSGLTLA